MLPPGRNYQNQRHLFDGGTLYRAASDTYVSDYKAKGDEIRAQLLAREAQQTAKDNTL